MNERRYGDEEVRKILDLAIRRDAREITLARTEEGLSLRELQEIASEVGLGPEDIARAVAEFEGRDGPLPRASTLGVPRAVGRLVSLPRAPSNDEWEMIVSDLRATFGTSGRVGSSGGVLEWSHEGLHAVLERTPEGHRLRLTDTMPASLQARASMGGFFVGFGVLMILVMIGKGEVAALLPGLFALLGAGMLATGVTALSAWAREREQQMEAIAQRAQKLLAQGEKP